MDRSKIRPLEPLDLRARPLAPHAISWSCDAELAVATDDLVHVYLPEYPKTGVVGDDGGDDDFLQPQFALSLTACGIFKPDPATNGPLCAFAGVSLPKPSAGDALSFDGAGHGLVTSFGSALGQSLQLQWSPTGLGHNLRPILAVLTTTGNIIALGEHVEHGSSMASSTRSRTFKNWKVLWGLGAQLPIPDGESRNGYRNMNERIISFSWAKEIAPDRALLAYMNDAREVVVMTVRYIYRPGEPQSGIAESGWEMFEVDRFDGAGPHDVPDSADPDFVPGGSGFSVSWSPWYISSVHRTATIAYVTNNYVGFRKVTIEGDWILGQDPKVQVEETNTMSICIYLSSDAFVEWESAIWEDGLAQMGRGIIATPFIVKPFQIDLCGSPSPPTAPHTTQDCSTTYAKPDEISTNPITGLLIHQPDPSNKPATPLYSLVRLSATPANEDWYQTNVSYPDGKLPQWTERLRRAVTREVSRVEALGGVDSESDTDSEFGEPDVDMTQVEQENMSKARPHRFRLWGIAASPGDGSMAALVTKHVTQHADRRGRARVLFGWQAKNAAAASQDTRYVPHNLTTEGKLWEATYGNLVEMPNLSSGANNSAAAQNPLRSLFKSVIPNQKCVFCNTELVTIGDESTCQKGHSFATCTATGLAIMAPGVSRVCSVCELRCLNVSELSRIAKETFGPDTVLESSGDVCGGCGGKFLI